MRLSVIVTVLTILAGAAVCAAEPFRAGPYMSAFIGASMIRDADVSSKQYFSGETFHDRVEFDPGINLGITGGYNYGFFRLEGELSYKSGTINDITDKSDGYRFHSVNGDIGLLAVMLNGFLDLHNNSAVTPYLGGGVGFATIYLDDTYGTDTRGGGNDRVILYYDDTASAFAYQLGGGLEIALNPRLSLDLSYRYFVTSEAEFDDDWDGRAEFAVKSNNVAVGLRVKF